MTEEKTQAAMLLEIDGLREELHRMVDQKVDAFLLTLLHGEQMDSLNMEGGKVVPLGSSPSVFKGSKPAAIIYPDGSTVEASTWRKAIAEILRDCSNDPRRHASMMALRDRVSGNFRCLISKSPDNMSAPLKIDEELYVEGKFDTEALLRNITQKIFDPVGYEYRGIVIQCRPTVQECSAHADLKSNDEPDSIEHTGGMTFG